MSDSLSAKNEIPIEKKKTSLRAKKIKSNINQISKKVRKTGSNKWNLNQINDSNVKKIVRAMSPIDDLFDKNSNKSRKIKVINKSLICEECDHSADNRLQTGLLFI